MTRKQIKKIIKITENLGASLLMLGTVFYVQHWDYSKIIFTFGVILGSIAFIYKNFILEE